MPKVIYQQANGERRTIDVPVGHTVMEGAVDNGIQGILAECGGACACATCHAYVDEAWVGRLKPMDDMEDAMLDTAEERRPESRLTCQIEVTDGLDGLVVTVAPNEP
ncbi:MAG: 2Fe-2S iron-sulfur cluster binding domain-containing protein [Chromatiales bacterium]|nr:2Fe-2S iron-sulfur cluster binding domain-containing protein [Chromatiales bacterium]